jgi:serine/threonine-protein kinase
VRRHLDRRPVVARRDTVVYRTGKLLRRHGTVVAVLVGAFLSVGGFAVGAQRQARETALERDRAQQVVDFLVELFANADPYRTRGAELTVREVLDRGAERAQTELKEQPMVRATLLEAIAEAYRSLGHLETSVDLRAEALDARRRSLGPDSPELSTYVAKGHAPAPRVDPAAGWRTRSLRGPRGSAQRPGARMAGKGRHR